MRAADWWFLSAPCFALLAIVATCGAMGADLALSKCFYCDKLRCFPLAESEPWGTLYRHGCLPAVCVGVAGLVVGLVGVVCPSLRGCRRPGLFLAATLALGPGLIVNGVLKPNVGRPRPVEVTDFGGERSFAFIGGSTENGPSKSFPSGHASMGFFLMTPALLLYKRRPRLALATAIGGLTFGVLMGAARIVQGAHFVTDVLASAVFVYVSGLAVLASANVVRYLLNRHYGAAGVTDESEPTILAMPQRAETSPSTAAADEEPRRHAA